MIRTEVNIATSIMDTAALPTRLVVNLSSDNEDWSLTGRIVINGLGAETAAKIEDELVRRLGGRCTLSLGPPEGADILSALNLTRALNRFCLRWGLSTRDLEMKTGLSTETIRRALSGQADLRHCTRRRLAALVDRMTQRPTRGEYLKHCRIRSRYRLVDAAIRLKVANITLSNWEVNGKVPPEKQQLMSELYGLPNNFWDSEAPPVLDIMAPAADDMPPMWGDRTKRKLAQKELIEELVGEGV